MAAQIPTWVKPGIGGAILGAVAITVLGFSADWVVTTGKARVTAERQADGAVVAALAPICVAQFRTAPQADRSTHLAALEKESYWERGDYVEAQGWATMPGDKEADDAVAEACATELLKVSNKPAGGSAGKG